MAESQPKRTCAHAPSASTVVITTNQRHLHTMRHALLADLSKQLEAASEGVDRLVEVSEPFGTVTAHDVRSQVSWIVETIETLDDLGWARESGWEGYRP